MPLQEKLDLWPLFAEEKGLDEGFVLDNLIVFDETPSPETIKALAELKIPWITE